jgi:hypothetical protein
LLKKISASVTAFFISFAFFYFLSVLNSTFIKKSIDLESSSDILTREVKKLYPRAAGISLGVVQSSGGIFFDSVYDSQKNLLGLILKTGDKVKGIKGYAGATPLIVYLDDKKKIININLDKNNETPVFVNTLKEKGFFRSWQGLTLKQACNKEVHTVTGATMTSKSVILTLKEYINSYILNENNSYILKEKSVRQGQAAGRFLQTAHLDNHDYSFFRPLLMGITLICGLLIFFMPSKFIKFRYFQYVLSILVPCFYLGIFVSITFFSGIISAGSLGLYLASSCPLMLIFAAAALLLPFIKGKNFYCTFLCPYGALQELAALPGRGSRFQLRLSPGINKIFSLVKKLLGPAVLLIFAFNYYTDIYWIEPFSGFLYSIARPEMIAFALVFVIFSLFVPRLWCRAFCAVGGLLDLACLLRNRLLKLLTRKNMGVKPEGGSD